VLGTFIANLVGHGSEVLSVAFDSSNLLASGAKENVIRLWNSTNFTEGFSVRTLIGHESWVMSVAFGQDGILASGSTDSTVKIWDTTAGYAVQTIQPSLGFPLCLAFDGVGEVLASGVYNGLELWKKT
jgi:WD40 repeat protein